MDRLIGALESDDAAERMLAITALERITGETFGYDFAAPRAERTAAIGRWLEWRRAGHANETTRPRGPGAAPARGRGMGDGA